MKSKDEGVFSVANVYATYLSIYTQKQWLLGPCFSQHKALELCKQYLTYRDSYIGFVDDSGLMDTVLREEGVILHFKRVQSSKQGEDRGDVEDIRLLSMFKMQ